MAGFVFPQTSIAQGTNALAAGLERRRERQSQEELAALAPQILAGDSNALARGLALNPQATSNLLQVYGQQQDRQTKMDAATKERLGGQMKEAAAWVLNVPEGQESAVWPEIQAKYPELKLDPWNPAFRQRAMGILGKVPEAAKPTELQRNLADPATAAYLREQMAAKGQQQGGTPYFQFLPGADGYYVGDARTGQMSPGMVNGQRAVPGALSPSLQGEIAGAKAGAQADIERDTTKRERTRSADDAINLLDEAEGILASGSTTGSVPGAAVDIVAGAVGKSTSGAQNTARLKTIGGQLVAKMPRMEGPQSNYDVQLYKEMAGKLDDQTVPPETRMAALQQIRRLNQKYASQQAKSDGPAKVTNDAEFNALPSGTEFIGPDGKRRRKP